MLISCVVARQVVITRPPCHRVTREVGAAAEASHSEAEATMQQPSPNRSVPPQPHSLPRFVSYHERPRAQSSRDGRRAGMNGTSRAYHSISRGTSRASIERMSHSRNSPRSSSPMSSPRLIALSPQSHPSHSGASHGHSHGGSLRSPFNTRHSSRSTVSERAPATGGTFPRNVSSSMFSLKGEDFSNSRTYVRKSPRIDSSQPSTQLLFADERHLQDKDMKARSAPSTPSMTPLLSFADDDDYVPASVPMYAAPASPVVPTVAYDAPSFTPRYTKKRSQSSANRKRSATTRRRRAEKKSTSARHTEKRSTTSRRMEGSPSAPPLLAARSSPLAYSPLLGSASASEPYSPQSSPVFRSSTPNNDTVKLLGQHSVKLGSSSSHGDTAPPKSKKSSVAKHLLSGFNNVLGGGTKPADSSNQSSGSYQSHGRVSSSSSQHPGRHQPKASASLSNLGDLRTRR